MSDFDKKNCQTHSHKRKFGLCDDDNSSPAYLDEQNGANWIAIVENDFAESICFTAIDNCIDLKNNDGSIKKRCDGMVSYTKTIIFIELKDRNIVGNQWIKDGENQLKSTISSFENTDKATSFNVKKAYIANKARPKFRESQMERMERFKNETGYTLRIENRIKIK